MMSRDNGSTLVPIQILRFIAAFLVLVGHALYTAQCQKVIGWNDFGIGVEQLWKLRIFAIGSKSTTSEQNGLSTSTVTFESRGPAAKAAARFGGG
jgi:hypothetical protein